jgi:hypothetical protein
MQCVTRYASALNLSIGRAAKPLIRNLFSCLNDYGIRVPRPRGPLRRIPRPRPHAAQRRPSLTPSSRCRPKRMSRPAPSRATLGMKAPMCRIVGRLIEPLLLPSRSSSLSPQRRLRRPAIVNQLDLRPSPPRAICRWSILSTYNYDRPRHRPVPMLRSLLLADTSPIELPAPRLAVVLHPHGGSRSNSAASSSNAAAIRSAIAASPLLSPCATAIPRWRSARFRRAAMVPARMSSSS